MKGVDIESGVNAEALVFLDYFKDFPHTRQGGFAGLAMFRRCIARRCPRGPKIIVREACFLPGAGTLRKNASAY